MLNLEREIGKSVVVDGDVKVTVLEVRQSRKGVSVVLGFTAPKEKVIDREEVHLKKIEEAQDNAEEKIEDKEEA